MFSHRGFLLLACWSLIGAQFQPSLAAQKSGGVAGVTEHVVFDGLKGWEKDGLTYRLACGALLIQAPNGDLLCTWLSGTDNEPSTDNCVLIARSADKGTTWTEPDILIPAGEMAGAVTSLHTTTDGRIILFGAHWPSREQYTVWHFFRQESRDSGHTWSPPVPVVLHENHAFIKAARSSFPMANSFFPHPFSRSGRSHFPARPGHWLRRQPRKKLLPSPPLRASRMRQIFNPPSWMLCIHRRKRKRSPTHRVRKNWQPSAWPPRTHLHPAERWPYRDAHASRIRRLPLARGQPRQWPHLEHSLADRYPQSLQPGSSHPPERWRHRPSQ
ncbi:MAG: exo-alpha-sialidase [Candidatus Omnitrophica bacterium]|nr:exo-alpha-sialidase [Candidatus Omnitrophota bacterium]